MNKMHVKLNNNFTLTNIFLNLIAGKNWKYCMKVQIIKCPFEYIFYFLFLKL